MPKIKVSAKLVSAEAFLWVTDSAFLCGFPWCILCPCIPGVSPPLYKDTSRIGLGRTPLTSFNLNYICIVLCPKSHIAGRVSTWIFRGHKSVHNSMSGPHMWGWKSQQVGVSRRSTHPMTEFFCLLSEISRRCIPHTVLEITRRIKPRLTRAVALLRPTELSSFPSY